MSKVLKLSLLLTTLQFCLILGQASCLNTDSSFLEVQSKSKGRGLIMMSMQQVSANHSQNKKCISLAEDGKCLQIHLAQLQPLDDNSAQAAIDPNIQIGGILSIPQSMSSIQLVEITLQNKGKDGNHRNGGGNNKGHNASLSDIQKSLGLGRRLPAAKGSSRQKAICQNLARFVDKKMDNLRGDEIRQYNNLIQTCKQYITDIDMAVVESNGEFKMLMPDGKFLEVLIYQKFISGSAFLNYKRRFGVNYMAKMINGDQLKITVFEEAKSMDQANQPEKLITDIKHLKK